GAVYRTFPSAHSSFPDRTDSSGAGAGTCGPAGTVFFPAPFIAFYFWPCYSGGRFFGVSRVVPCAERKVLRWHRYPAHVGRRYSDRDVLGLLDVTRANNRTACTEALRYGSDCWGYCCVVDRISWRPDFSRRGALDRIHAFAAAACNRSFERRPSVAGCGRQL